MVSVIVPVYNEETILAARRDYFEEISREAELIFVDGGSFDGTPELIRSFDGSIKSGKGRSVQMNAGAQKARHEILLFLHVDTRLDLEIIRRIPAYVKQGYVGGAFRQVIDRQGLLFRWIAFTGNIRARMSGVFYGDQGIFVRKDVFDAIGGFPEYAIGEDVYFSRKLKQQGRVRLWSDPIYCSARRWEQQGVIRTSLMNARVKMGLALGQSKKQLSNEYRDVR